jgi:gamma-glutamylcyclotransferase (GGCT)/AIG2-like uncharacterized protein YtfP
VSLLDGFACCLAFTQSIAPRAGEATAVTMALNRFFVYGTLKRGESNHDLIAAFAEAIVPASVRGTLYDFGPWPAMTAGEATVYGELVHLDAQSVVTVLPLLDRLEEYDPRDEARSVYLRRVVTCWINRGDAVEAYTYLYRGDVQHCRRVHSGRWPD